MVLYSDRMRNYHSVLFISLSDETEEIDSTALSSLVSLVTTATVGKDL